MKIAPSLLACDFARMGDECAAMALAGAGLLHLDIMDGHFVPNISFGPPVVKALRPRVDIPFDVHLMVTHPIDYILPFAKAGADIITFHIEAASPVKETIARIRGQGVTPGLVVKPKTDIREVFGYLDQVGMVLIMTVEPGFGGQAFMEDQLPKIAALRKEVDARGLAVDIQVDGGISRENIAKAAAAGANVFVAGSALFSQADYAAGIRELKQLTVDS